MRWILITCVVLASGSLSCVADSTVNHTAMATLSPSRPRPLPLLRRTTFPRVTPRPWKSVRPVEVSAWYPRGGKFSPRWTHIVLHHSATHRGGARRFDKNHREVRNWDSLGYHFVIGNGTDTPDGFVEVGPRWWTQKHGAHCKTPDNYFNEHGIGICLVGDFTKSSPTGAQIASLNRLVQFLGDHCGISPDSVITHRDVTGNTQCPGNGLKLVGIRRTLASGT